MVGHPYITKQLCKKSRTCLRSRVHDGHVLLSFPGRERRIASNSTDLTIGYKGYQLIRIDPQKAIQGGKGASVNY